MSVRVLVLRPLRLRGEHVPADREVSVSPIDAADLIASGRASLADQGDATAVHFAVQAATAAALRSPRRN
jgi:hypothetical protein